MVEQKNVPLPRKAQPARYVAPDGANGVRVLHPATNIPLLRSLLSMKIGIGSDHAGFELKEDIKAYLQEEFAEHEIIDFGTNSSASTSYAEYGANVGHAVANGKLDRGILICGSGIGISMTAGRIRGVRVALCHDAYTAKMSRLHNNANVLAMGGRVVGKGVARDLVKIWLETPFEGGRHQLRVEQIDALTC